MTEKSLGYGKQTVSGDDRKLTLVTDKVEKTDRPVDLHLFYSGESLSLSLPLWLSIVSSLR